MLEHLSRKKVLRAKILMQNVLKRQIPPQNYRGAMYRGEVLSKRSDRCTPIKLLGTTFDNSNTYWNCHFMHIK